MSAKKNILIIGGAGFIGSNLVKRLLQHNAEVTVIDKVSQQIHGKEFWNSELFKYVRENSNFIFSDFSTYKHIVDVLKENDILIHLASETGTGQSMYEVNEYVKSNVMGYAKLLHTIVNNNIELEKFILTSSRAVYGEGAYLCKLHGRVNPQGREIEDMKNKYYEPRCPFCNEFVTSISTKESDILNPTSVYGVTKATQEQLLTSVLPDPQTEKIIFRFQNVYGPGQSLINPYTGILAIFANIIKNNDSIQVFEDGLESRDFVFIDDVIDSIIRSIELEFRSKIIKLNVGSGIKTTVIDLINTFQDILGTEINYEISHRFRKGDIRHNFADLELTNRNLSYKPSTDLHQGLKQFIDWVNNINYELPRIYNKTLKELNEQ